MLSAWYLTDLNDLTPSFVIDLRSEPRIAVDLLLRFISEFIFNTNVFEVKTTFHDAFLCSLLPAQ